MRYLILFLVMFNVYAVDKRLSELDPITSVELTSTDLLYVSDISATATKYLTVSEADSRWLQEPNDLGTTTSDLWSAFKIQSELPV